jgi:hypothetical protein
MASGLEAAELRIRAVMKFATAFLAGASAIALLVSAGSAAATITLATGQFGGTGVHSTPGMVAQTVTGTAGADLVTLSTTGNVFLHTSGGGESDYNAVNSGDTASLLLTSLSVDFTFMYDAVTFNLSPPNGGTSNMFLSVNGGAFTFNVPNASITDPLGNGQNKFTLNATGGDAIHTLDFTFDPGVDHIQQIRVGNILGGIPEPTTWAMMILGFGGVGSLLRRGRGQRALAA